MEIQLFVAVSGTSFILLGVLILLVFGVGYGLYTRQGSGVNKHPREDSQDPVVGEDDDHVDERAGVDRTESAEMEQRGTH